MIDDFFAQDFDSVKVPKVKKHKKKRPAREVPSLLDFGEFGAKRVASVEVKNDTNEAIGDSKSTKTSEIVSRTSVVDTFESELGISSVSHDAVSDRELLFEPEVATQTDSTKGREDEPDIVEVELRDKGSGVNDSNNDDDFDSDLKAYQEQIQKNGSELIQRINQDLSGDVEFDGTTVPIGSILICINVIVEIGEFKSDNYQLKLKSGKNVQKVIKLFVNQFNSQYNTRIIEEEYINSLVLYFPKLNLYLEPEMSFSTVVRCKDNLDTTFDSTKGVFGISCNARLLMKNKAEDAIRERESQIKSEIQKFENDSTILGSAVNIKLIDSDTKKETILEVSNTAPFFDIVELYRIRTELPDILDLAFTKCNDASEVLSENKISSAHFDLPINEILTNRRQYISVSYSKTDLEELQKHYAQTEHKSSEETLSQQHVTNEQEGEAEEDGHFAITLLVSEKKRYKVKVKPTTQVSELIFYFISRNPEYKKKKIELLFDNEPLPLDEEIQFTEIEEDDIIDVIIRN